MSKFTTIVDSVFSIFASVGWSSEGIPTVPANFKTPSVDKFIRVDVLPAGAGYSFRDVSGVLIIDIFVPSGEGPKGYADVADKLDKHLLGKSLATLGANVQFFGSSVSPRGIDRDNPALYRAEYTIKFQFSETH